MLTLDKFLEHVGLHGVREVDKGKIRPYPEWNRG